MVTDRVDSAIDMVAKGLGYSFFSEFMVRQILGVHKYEMCRLNGEPYYRNTWVVPNRDAMHLKIVRCFVDFVSNFTFANALDNLHPRGHEHHNGA